MATQTLTRPGRRIMYGLTHSADGRPIVREPRALKIGIGLPKGKGIHAYIRQDGKWVVAVGKELKTFDSKDDARRYYFQSREGAPDRNYPQRLAHFTFAQVSSTGEFFPDFDAIELHGPQPHEIDIVFLSDDPFDYSYQMWTQTELKCRGDGLNAQRVLSMAQEGTVEEELAAAAKAEGQKTFPIIEGCWTRGCPYAQATERNGKRYASACRPHGRLLFQLLNQPRLGGTAYFDTTGFRSIGQLFSCLEIIRTWTGKGDPDKGFVAGIPLKLVLAPYKVVYEGKSTTQYAVRLEFRAESAVDLKRRLIEAGVQFRAAGTLPVELLGPAAEEAAEGETEETDDELPPEIAAAMVGEFAHGQAEPEGESEDHGGGDDFTDPDSPAPARAAPEMPRRKSETQVKAAPAILATEREPSENQDDFDNPKLDPWGDPLAGSDPVPDDPPPIPPSTPPAPEAPKPPAAAKPNGSVKPNGKKRASKEDVNNFYSACRAKGLNDQQILRQCGLFGFERLEEITADVMPQFIKWIRDLKIPVVAGPGKPTTKRMF